MFHIQTSYKKVPFLCNHKPESKGNSDQSQVTRNKSIVTVGGDREEAGEGNGQHRGDCKEWPLGLEE